MVGSVVYINRPEHCLSSSLSSADKLLSYWPFVNYRYVYIYCNKNMFEASL